VGSVTDTYRRLANEAAAAARAEGAEVVKVYSPNATWPAVKRATDGASIIVYLGHGNGWPSRYRDHLYPPTQNGFGLNPVAGGDDSSHQYFGEDAVEDLTFAPNAVVVLSHLCYASGNTEPGLSEGTRDQAVQRVDNYAAGFLRAGAKAVVAEAWMGPAYYVRALLGGRGSIESIWEAAPTYSGRHGISASSERTPGYTLRLDPRRGNGGYTRSLVARGLTAGELRSSARGTGGITTTTPPPVTVPSLASAGLRFLEPVFKALPIAGTASRVTLPLASGRTTRIPAGSRISVRWDPIKLDAPAAPAAPATTPVTPDPSVVTSPAPSSAPASADPPAAPATPGASAVPGSGPSFPTAANLADPSAAPAPSSSAAPAPVATPTPTPVPDAPEVDLVVPEQHGSVVEPLRAIRSVRGLTVDVAYPTAPGLYRLTATIHTPEGVAYDAATQRLLTPVLVRVGGALAAAYGVPPTLSLDAGASAAIAVQVLNAGSTRWEAIVATSSAGPDASAQPGAAFVLPTLVATWISAEGHAVPETQSVQLPGEAWSPGGKADVVVPLEAPALPGTYLLMLDVLTPADGPLSAKGSEPALVRVTVAGAPATPVPGGSDPATSGSPVPSADPSAPSSAPASSSTSPAAPAGSVAPVTIGLPGTGQG
jgi:hypothetical protein